MFYIHILQDNIQWPGVYTINIVFYPGTFGTVFFGKQDHVYIAIQAGLSPRAHLVKNSFRFIN